VTTKTEITDTIETLLTPDGIYIYIKREREEERKKERKKVRISLLQAVEAHRVARG
jgi:hypothetical protein